MRIFRKPSAQWKRWDSKKEFKRRDPDHYGDYSSLHDSSLSVVQISPRPLKPRTYLIHVITSWRTPAETKGPFTSILKVLDRRCSVDEPPALQASDSKVDRFLISSMGAKINELKVDIPGWLLLDGIRKLIDSRSIKGSGDGEEAHQDVDGEKRLDNCMFLMLFL
ncbi:hypothetical protein B9Z55_008219 [Caenorhabditis nigoni]|uniref:Uncharacterized protein n=1 Tax=Caenorhabditis nigoni TaxID=1611254 RepID=A0A2G5VD56_9PELO|nr:hypothetical protein B9Z55_008219 [Caenorhabditis nigoni]